MRSILIVCLGVAACGGKVVVDPTAGSGGASASSSPAVSSSVSGSPHTCPSPFPGTYAQCDVEGQVCPIPDACCGVSATCQGGVWINGAPTCAEPCIPCGNDVDGFACAADAVCVNEVLEIGGSHYSCAPNPCPGMPDCSCAASVCTTPGFQCVSTVGFSVSCVCTACDQGG